MGSNQTAEYNDEDQTENTLLKGLYAYFQMTLSTKMALPDVQWYPLKLCIIEDELDINPFFSF